MTEDELVLQNRKRILEALGKIDIKYDNFSRTHNETHFETSIDFFNKLKEK
ncbi:MAG: class I tRNA ligase family protein [Candidatus Peribacteria bacterium]|nr:class I tRNA ligase family protein [Candidatus Peribacteria bacterium]